MLQQTLQLQRKSISALGYDTKQGETTVKLMTKEISKRAQEAFKVYQSKPLAEQEVVAKFFDPIGSWTWYLLNQDPENTDYLWGIVKGHEVEIGSFSLCELESLAQHRILGIERDLSFTSKNAQLVYDGLLEGKHF